MTRDSWKAGGSRSAFVTGIALGACMAVVAASSAVAQSTDGGGVDIGADIGGVSADVGVGGGGVSADVGADVGGGGADVGADIGGDGADAGADIGGDGAEAGADIGGESDDDPGNAGGSGGGNASGGGGAADDAGGDDAPGGSPGEAVGSGSGGADDATGGVPDRVGILPGDQPGIRPMDRRYSYFTSLDVRTPAFRRYRAAAERNELGEAGGALAAATARPITEGLVVHVNEELDVQTALTPRQIVAAANGVPGFPGDGAISSAAEELAGER